MSDIARIADRTSHLCSISIYRRADGTIGCALLPDMHPRLIETTGKEVVDRMLIMAGWIDAAAADFRKQADALKPQE